MNKKKILIVAGIAMIAISLTGCKSEEEKALDAIIEQADKMSEIQDMAMRGEISNEEAEMMLGANKQEMVDATGRGADGFPAWAKKLGFDEPKNMVLKSGEQSEDGREGFTAVNLVYVGDYDTAMEEAEKIANGANVPVSKEHEMMKETLENMTGMPPEAMEAMKASISRGIIYSNFSLSGGGVTSGEKYQKMIIVEEKENGQVTLEINVVDFDELKEASENSGAIFGDDFDGDFGEFEDDIDFQGFKE